MDPLIFDLDAPPQPGCGVTRFQLRRLHAGELKDQERTDTEAHARDCLDCQAVLEELKSDDAAFRTHVPFAKFEAAFEKRLAAQQPVKSAVSRTWAWIMGGGLTLGLCAAGAVMLMPRTDAVQDSRERLKGRAPALGFVVQAEGGVKSGRQGQQLHEGDRIQFLVRAREQDRGVVVLGIDGKGAVTVYHQGAVPGGATQAAMPLPDSVVLDDALGQERFFVVTSPEASVETLARAAQDAAAQLVKDGADLGTVEKLPLSIPAEQDSITIEKVRK